ncbi:hypothetical protein [Mycobacterium bohemicum]|uniref:hypothetical protein n=1 Tax=Mycobacterium bohemicum TaxID=56425 RepID=UPI001111B87D|nr:hypothetical protein [Mycobacterium bohemicum]MCV6970313.1 hypothetical protein [Mycobacterium bohemicum]
MTDESPSDDRLEIAYEAARNSVSMQDQTLGNLRTRANNLLGTAALFTSFSTGIGLISTTPGSNHVLSPIKGIILLLVLIALSFFVLSVLWPADDWLFGPSAAEIMAKIDPNPSQGGTQPQPKDIDQIRRDVIKTLIAGYETNNDVLAGKHRAFRRAALLLVAEVFILVVMLWIWK